MTFNPNSDISGGNVKRRGRGAAVGGGVGIVGVIVVFVVSQLTGVDIGGLVGGGAQSGPTGPDEAITECQTGEDANASVDCLMKGAAASIEDFWAEAYPSVAGNEYVTPSFILFDQSTTTGCGAASSATGPFYCPPDQTIYIDTTFFQQLREPPFDTTGGTLAQMYIAAHEWGHHIQNISGIMGQADRTGTGADSGSVRIELQADCFAGAWVAAASETDDASGTKFLEPPTRAQVTDALDAAAAVGDDRIQQGSGQEVDAEAWTHGSSEQRQRWFSTGHEGGAASCDTFGVDGAQL
ncbi:neutral zinc metallopeptidase [Mycetocola sp.]|uniref:KPN_02809 family neutral zinc metallopeptidase n=1 Tax=Mycetocola sp. TaxID=1871042 RepID=UPI002625362F|nr:neutral zinc metallopeptidase [Mycetocola sp.]MCU1561182.1 neutral zinc metallopeptidase [Mycetocola sp.]